MNRSGIKRGLAVSAISALALSGLAFTSAQAQTIAQGEVGVELYTGSPSNAYTNQFDGVNTSVQLFAGVNTTTFPGANSVRFSYTKGPVQVNITTVPLFTGVATANWVAPAGAEGAAIDGLRAEALDVNGDPIAAAVDTNFVVGTATPNVGFLPVSINGALRSDLGISPDGAVVITGKTREATATVGDPFPTTLVTNRGPAATGPQIPAFSTDVADVNALTPYAAIVPVNGGNLTADPVDEIVMQTRIFANGDDTQVYSAYDQVVTTVTKPTAPGFPANVAGPPPNQETRYVVTVKDQKGNAVSGLDVYESDVSGADLAAADGMGRTITDGNFDDGETTWDGTLTVRMNEAGAVYGIDGTEDQEPAVGTGATYVVVDVNQNGVYDNGLDHLLKLTNTNLPLAPANIAITSSLGNAMDDDESTTLTFKVTDASGDPVNGAALSGNVAKDVADNTPADSTTPLVIPNTDINGESTIVLNPGENNNEVAATITATSGAASGSLAIESGRADIFWDSNFTAQALANTSTTQGGTMELPSGTVLPNRTVGLTLIPTDNILFAPQAEQPAGTIRGGDTLASATTDASGAFSVKVDDPPLPVGQELDSTLSANGVAQSSGGDLVQTDLDLDFLRSLTPSRLEVLNDQVILGGTTADGLRPGLGGTLRPGGLGIGEVVVYNSDNVALDDIDVTLNVDEGFFVDIADPFEPTPAVGAPIDWASQGQTFTVNTGDTVGGGIGAAEGAVFLANIERNTGFDDDGLVRDAITATAGAASDEHDMTWTTNGVPVNPRATNPLVVELSADQESSILPKARAGDIAGSGQEVDYDVSTYDQFGNPTSQNVDVTDNTPLADFNGGVASTFALFQPAISAYADAATNQSLEVELEGSNTITYFDNPGDSAFDPAFPLAFLQSNPVVVEDNTDAINWYDLNLAASEFSLKQSGPNVVPVGTTVTEILTAVDQEGQYIEGLFVDFLRGGPGDEDDDSCNEDLLNGCPRLNANGKAFYDFAGGRAGTANVSAVIYEDDGTRFGQVGTDTVSFVQVDGPRLPIDAKLSGRSGAGMDVLTVRAGKAAGARVKLFKIVNGKKSILKTGALDGNGVEVLKVRDTKPNAKTTYVAIVSSTAVTKRDKTNTKTLR